MTREGKQLLAALEACGLLLMTDAKLPNAVALLAGGPVKGSWWGHDKGNLMYNAMNELFDHTDVFSARLVNDKVTFVHRPLWRALAGTGAEGASWQRDGLPAAAKALLVRVAAEGEVSASGEAVRALEKRLLVASEQVHTASGAHAKVACSWAAWAKRRGLKGPFPAGKAARTALEAAAGALAQGSGGVAKLPWGARLADG